MKEKLRIIETSEPDLSSTRFLRARSLSTNNWAENRNESVQICYTKLKRLTIQATFSLVSFHPFGGSFVPVNIRELEGTPDEISSFSTCVCSVYERGGELAVFQNAELSSRRIACSLLLLLSPLLESSTRFTAFSIKIHTSRPIFMQLHCSCCWKENDLTREFYGIR